MRALFVLATLSLLGCPPAVDGATCLHHDNCPDEQYCASSCLCVLGERAAKPQACAGFKQSGFITLDNASTVAVVQVSSAGRVASVWVNFNSRVHPEARQYQQQADGTWSSVGGFEMEIEDTASPMGLSPAGTTIAIRSLAGVRRYDVGPLATANVDVWYVAPPESVIAVAHAGDQVVASFSSRGTFQKRVGLSTSLDGTQLDTAPAQELQISNDTSTVVARFGSEVKRFTSAASAGSWRGISALDLSADGTALALVTLDGGVSVELANRGSFPVPVAGVSHVALDAAGRTLIALSKSAPAVFGFDGGTWARLGELPIGSSTASGVALSDDGKSAFIGTPWDSKVLIFTSFR